MHDINILIPIALPAHFYSFFCFVFFIAVAFSSTYITHQKPALDRTAFWILGSGLFLFTLARPVSLARDDIAYLDIAQSICDINECGLLIQGHRDWLWYLSIAVFKAFLSNEQSLMALASVGVAIKLLVIDQLCKQRLLALVLFIPLTYIQYDLTQLRAGLAISWYFVAVLFLIKNKTWLSSSFLASNFLLHSQALPSILLLPFTWLNQRQWILPITVVGFLALIYTGFFPSFELMQQLHIAKSGADAYLAMNASGEYINVKIFPLGYLPILAFGLWLCRGNNPQKNRLCRIVGASILLAIFLAWLFSFNPTIQTRMFELYIAPLVLLAGNIGSNKTKLVGTIALSGILYIRLEWLHDWIIG